MELNEMQFIKINKLLYVIVLMMFPNVGFAQDIWVCVQKKYAQVYPESAAMEYSSNNPVKLEWLNEDSFRISGFGEFNRNKKSALWNDTTGGRTAYINRKSMQYTNIVVVSGSRTFNGIYDSWEVWTYYCNE